jgi:hypothetical protein
MTIQDFTRRFRWRRDTVDSFRILSAPTGPLEGDCDDFAVTALWIAEGRSLWRFWLALCTGRAAIWRVKGVRWVSHAVLWHREHGWIDCQNPTWGPNRDVLRWPRMPWTIALKMLIGKLSRR